MSILDQSPQFFEKKNIYYILSFLEHEDWRFLVKKTNVFFWQKENEFVYLKNASIYQLSSFLKIKHIWIWFMSFCKIPAFQFIYIIWIHQYHICWRFLIVIYNINNNLNNVKNTLDFVYWKYSMCFVFWGFSVYHFICFSFYTLYANWNLLFLHKI